MFGPRIGAVAILAFGVMVVYQTVLIGSEEGYGPAGPAFFPLIVAVGLLVFGVLFLVQTTVRPDPAFEEHIAEEEAATRWPTVGLVVLALLVYAFVLDPLGYPIATALFFVAVARILGSRRLVRDAVIGVVVSCALYFGFTEFLGVRLSGGLLEVFL